MRITSKAWRGYRARKDLIRVPADQVKGLAPYAEELRQRRDEGREIEREIQADAKFQMILHVSASS